MGDADCDGGMSASGGDGASFMSDTRCGGRHGSSWWMKKSTVLSAHSSVRLKSAMPSSWLMLRAVLLTKTRTAWNMQEANQECF